MDMQIVRDKIAQSLTPLTPEERAVLEATRHSDLAQTSDALAATARLDSIQAQSALLRLQERGILTPEPYKGTTIYRFADTSQAQYAYAAINGLHEPDDLDWLVSFDEDEQAAANHKEAEG